MLLETFLHLTTQKTVDVALTVPTYVYVTHLLYMLRVNKNCPINKKASLQVYVHHVGVSGKSTLNTCNTMGQA
jgi:hypothetical protein